MKIKLSSELVNQLDDVLWRDIYNAQISLQKIGLNLTIETQEKDTPQNFSPRRTFSLSIKDYQHLVDRGGHKIQMIKSLRQATGFGLKTCKDMIDGLEDYSNVLVYASNDHTALSMVKHAFMMILYNNLTTNRSCALPVSMEECDLLQVS